MTSNLIFLVTCSANTYDVNRVTHGLFLVLMSVIVYCMLLAWCSQLLTVFSFPRKSMLLTLRPGTSINKWIIMRHLKCCFFKLLFFPFFKLHTLSSFLPLHIFWESRDIFWKIMEKKPNQNPIFWLQFVLTMSKFLNS